MTSVDSPGRVFSVDAAAEAALVLAVALLLALPGPSRAQQLEDRSVAVGAQMGAPTGLFVQVEAPSPTYELHLAWRLDRFVVVDGHVLLEEGPIPGMDLPSSLIYQLGPGVHGRVRRGTAVIGPSGTVGLEWRFGAFEAFARLTPRVELLPGTRFGVGGGFGLRVVP